MKANSLTIFIESEKDSRKRHEKTIDKISKGEFNLQPKRWAAFHTQEEFGKFLTDKRVELLKTIKHKKPKSIYELAKLVKRSPENVNKDVWSLKLRGFVDIEKVNEPRKRSVPTVSYDNISWELKI